MPTPSTPLRMLALAGVAVAGALLSNALQSPSRRLPWRGLTPPVPPAQAAPSEVPAPPAPAPPAASAPLPEPPRPARMAAPAPSVTVVPPPTAAAAPIREIDGQEAWKAFQAGRPFLDARRSADYAAGHIAGAWCAPVWEADLDDRLLSFKAARRPGPEDPIVLYCSGGDCRDSHLLAARLLEQGYFHLLVYRDGFPDWLAAGRPVEKGLP